MKYLHLKFENAGLIHNIDYKTGKDLDTNSHLIRTGPNEYQIYNKELNRGHDLKTPINWTTLSNVLHVLCGKTPVPTIQYHSDKLKRNEVLDEIAKKSYIKYDIKPIFESKPSAVPRVLNSEVFTFAKIKKNSHTGVVVNYELHNGEILHSQGSFNWVNLHRVCSSQEKFDALCHFLSEALGQECNPKTYTIQKLVYDISQYWGDENFKQKVQVFLSEWEEKKPQLLAPWKGILFGDIKADKSGKLKVEMNTCYYSKCPLVIKSNVSRIIYVSGHIICPIDNEEVIQWIRRNKGVARILEGGMVYIHSLSAPDGFEYDYEKIFEGKASQSIDTQEVM